MTRHKSDEEIRSTLARLRAHDEQSVPGFERVLAHRAANPRQPASWFAWRLPVGIAAAILLAVGTYVITSRQRMTLPEDVVALSTWRPATDVLLDTPGRQLLTHAPQLGASLIDIQGGIPR